MMNPKVTIRKKRIRCEVSRNGKAQGGRIIYETRNCLFIDPKDKPSEQNDLTLEVFSKKIMRQ